MVALQEWVYQPPSATTIYTCRGSPGVPHNHQVRTFENQSKKTRLRDGSVISTNDFWYSFFCISLLLYIFFLKVFSSCCCSSSPLCLRARKCLLGISVLVFRFAISAAFSLPRPDRPRSLNVIARDFGQDLKRFWGKLLYLRIPISLCTLIWLSFFFCLVTNRRYE